MNVYICTHLVKFSPYAAPMSRCKIVSPTSAAVVKGLVRRNLRPRAVCMPSKVIRRKPSGICHGADAGQARVYSCASRFTIFGAQQTDNSGRQSRKI